MALAVARRIHVRRSRQDAGTGGQNARPTRGTSSPLPARPSFSFHFPGGGHLLAAMKRISLRGLYSPELLESRIAPATFLVTTLADAGAGSLRAAIDGIGGVGGANDTPGADTITFAPALFPGGAPATITLTTGQIPILDSLAIKGAGIDKLTISGNNASRIFLIDDGTAAIKTVSISGLTLIDGKATGNGGAIYDTENLALTNVVIASSTSSLYGGGVYAMTDGKLSVTGSIITGNHADGGGGGMWVRAKLGITLSKTTISFNSTTGTTGGVYLDNSGTTKDVLVDSVLIAGNAQAQGGGIQFAGPAERKMTIKNSLITGNNNTGTTSGGGLYLEIGNLVVDKCVFSNNGSGKGGAIGDNEGNSLIIKNSRFFNNTATDAGGAGGGALYLKGAHPVTITGSVFAGNSSASNGGAIAAIALVTVNIKTSTFSGNTAAAFGGALDARNGADVIISGGSFSENRAGPGGAISISGTGASAADLTVTGTLFQANVSENNGGAIRAASDGLLLIKSAKFISNVALADGGGVYLNAPTSGAGTRMVVSSLFRANVAGDDGGGMDVLAATTITSCLFIGNTADHLGGNGGGLRLFIGTSTITKSVFTGNFASIGGGIHNTGTASTVDAATKVTGNAARILPNKSGI